MAGQTQEIVGRYIISGRSLDKAADKRQYENYKDVLGAKNMPKSFDKWQNLKYNEDKSGYEELKGFYRYKGANPKASRNDYLCAAELHRLFPQGTFHVPAKNIDVSTLKFDDTHINKEREHKVTEAAAKEYIQNAKVSRTVWQGQFERYYSINGAAYVNNENNIIRTSFAKEEFKGDAKEIMEVLKKYGI